jgi:DNA ligase-1
MIFLPWAFTAKGKRSLYESVLARGGEGIMLKRLDALYVQGGRPVNNWLKAKKSATFDCVVMGFTKGKGKYNNRIGALVFGQYVNGKLSELGQASGMSDAERNDMSLRPDTYIGKVVTIKGMERLKSGAIRHPQYAGIRHDKDRHQCRWYPNEQ